MLNEILWKNTNMEEFWMTNPVDLDKKDYYIYNPGENNKLMINQ